MSRKGWLLFAALGVAWGMPYLFIRIAVAELDPLIVACGRTVLGAMILLPLALRRRALRPVLRRWPLLLVYTVVEIVVPWLMIGHAELRLNSSTTGLLLCLVPIAAAIFVTVLGQDRFDPRRVIGLALGMVGVATLVGLDLDLSDGIAVLQLMLAVIGYAIGPIIVNRYLADLPPVGVITGSLICASVVFLPFTPLVWPARVGAASVVSVVVLAVICTALAFLLMFALIAEAGPARMTMITYVNPVVAILLGAAVLDEPLTVGLLLGFPLIIAGSVLGTWRSRQPPADSAPAHLAASRASSTVRGKAGDVRERGGG